MQIFADNPYTDKQLIVNAVLLLRQARILPTKDFDDWDALPVKMWSTLKDFFHEAFTRRLNAISMHPTSGQHGYANPNPYTIFNLHTTMTVQVQPVLITLLRLQQYQQWEVCLEELPCHQR